MRAISTSSSTRTSVRRGLLAGSCPEALRFDSWRTCLGRDEGVAALRRSWHLEPRDRRGPGVRVHEAHGPAPAPAAPGVGPGGMRVLTNARHADAAAGDVTAEPVH